METKNQWMEKGARREERISYLKTKGELSASESGELNGLISRCCDPPDIALPTALFVLMLARTRVLHIAPPHSVHCTHDVVTCSIHRWCVDSAPRFRGLQLRKLSRQRSYDHACARTAAAPTLSLALTGGRPSSHTHPPRSGAEAPDTHRASSLRGQR